MVKFYTVLDQTITHINVKFGVLWLNREPAVNRMRAICFAPYFVLRRRFQDLRSTEQSLARFYGKLLKVPADDLILRIPA